MPARQTQSTTAQRIVNAAGPLFHRNGITSISMDQVANDAGLTKMTLYQYFISKEALLLEVLRVRRVERDSSLEFRLDESDVSGKAQLLVVFDWLEEWLSKSHFRGCGFVNAAVEVGLAWPAVHEETLEAKLALRSILARHAKAAQIENYDAIADAFLLLIEGANTMSFLQGNGEAVRAAKRAARMLLDL